MTNHIELSPDHNCVECKYFQSWFMEFFGEDPYEPHDSGNCFCEDSPNYNQYICTECMVCDCFVLFAWRDLGGGV